MKCSEPDCEINAPAKEEAEHVTFTQCDHPRRSCEDVGFACGGPYPAPQEPTGEPTVVKAEGNTVFGPFKHCPDCDMMHVSESCPTCARVAAALSQSKQEADTEIHRLSTALAEVEAENESLEAENARQAKHIKSDEFVIDRIRAENEELRRQGELNHKSLTEMIEMLVTHRADVFGSLRVALAENRAHEDERAAKGADTWLRDQFAMAALTGYQAHPANEGAQNANHIAEYAYALADAMVEARNPKF